MKKILALLALVLGVVSCQTEPEGLDVNVGGEQEVMLTVSLPETTRANSANGFDLNSLKSTDYSLRYILEVYLGNNCQRHVLVSDNTTVAFPVRLAPDRDYQLVVWADIVKGNSEADRYYNTTNGLDEVTIIESNEIKWNAMNETRDAFTATKPVSAQDIASGAITMTLKRPFAKLRVVATDYEDVVDLGLKPATATVAYSQDMPRTYNALTGAVSDAADKSHNNITYPATPVYNDATGEYTLFADYFFVPESGTAKFQFNVYAEGTNLIKATNFNTDIYVAANKLTTIKGDVLTTGANINIGIEENGEFDEEKTITVVETAQHLQQVIDAIEEGGSETIVLGGDIDLGDLLGASILSTRATEPAYGLIIPKGKTVVLDLKGYTISQTKTQTTAYSMIDNRGTLIIKDSSEATTGKLNYTDNGQGGEYVSNTLHNSGVLTIEGGIIENNSSATVATNGYPHPIDNYGTLTINGGTFTNKANYSSMRIWCTTDDDTIVTIKGGTFNGSIDFQTPDAAANKGTLTITGGTFNADTYTNCAVRLLGFGADVDEMNGYISGGQFNGAIALRNWSGSELNSKVFNITGGTFTVNPSEFVDDGYKVVENGTYKVVEGDPIAKIGDVQYTTLQAAFDAVVGEATITLLSDATFKNTSVLAEGKTATLDLNGKTLSAADINVIKNNGGNLTIKNGTVTRTGDVVTYSVNNASGEITIENATIARGLYTSGSKMTANNANISHDQSSRHAIYAWNCEVAINGGTYHNDNAGNATLMAAGSSVVTINGGTFSIADGRTTLGWTSCLLDSQHSAKVIINNGTYNGGFRVQAGTSMTINGGSFNDCYGSNYNIIGTVTVKGGTYTDDAAKAFAEKYVAEGYVLDGNEVFLDVKVAKVGNTEYRKIDEAIAAWTNNTTLTLMSDVTLSDVISIKSTEYRILDLGTYTMTAASKKDAISITNEGRSSASYALDIKADATNPGGITATSKAVVKTTGKSGVKDRPIIRFYNGVFNASNIVSHSGSNGTNCPQFQFHNGVYNASLSADRALIQIYGGTFNGKFYTSVDSSAYMLISGGKFKYLDNLYGSALNTDKFTIGTAKGVFDRGVYVDDEGYIVVGGTVITEFGDKFAAKATNVSKAGSYLPYSSAAANGLYYTNAAAAIAKHGEANVELK